MERATYVEGMGVNRKLGLKLRRDATPEEQRAYDRARRALLKADPQWVRQRTANEADRRRRNRVRIDKQRRRWLDANPGRRREISRSYLTRHRERLNAKQREKNKTPERKAFMKKYAPQHRANNRPVYATYKHNRRARDLGALGAHTVTEWEKLLHQHRGLCAYCEATPATSRDHDIPLSRGGTNEISNIVPACLSCNSAKGALTGNEFRQRRAILKEFA